MLKLQPLDAVDTPPGAADRGTLIHDSIGEFAKTFPDKLPDDPVAMLSAIGARHFQPLADFPRPGRSGGRAFSASPNGWRGFETARRAKLVAV